MGLRRIWMRKLSAAAGAALLPAAAVLGAIAVLGIAGSFGGIASIGQALSGPAVPGGRLQRAPAPGGVVLSAAAVRVARSAHVAAARGRRAVAISGPARSLRGRGSSAIRVGGLSGSGGRSSATGSPRGGSGRSTGSAPSAPSPPQRQTAVDGVVQSGSAVTSKLPRPVGPIATGTLQSAGQTVDKVLGPHVPGRLPDRFARAGDVTRAVLRP